MAATPHPSNRYVIITHNDYYGKHNREIVQDSIALFEGHSLCNPGMQVITSNLLYDVMILLQNINSSIIHKEVI